MGYLERSLLSPFFCFRRGLEDFHNEVFLYELKYVSFTEFERQNCSKNISHTYKIVFGMYVNIPTEQSQQQQREAQHRPVHHGGRATLACRNATSQGAQP